MRTQMENGQFVIALSGRITSANAPQIQKECLQLLSEHPDCTPVIDAGEITYISSAGLRFLLLLSRQRGEKLIVRNVSPEVYTIFDVTGFVSILDVRRKLREFSVDGCEIIGQGAVGTVYRIDEDTIVKVYDLPDSLAMIENEQKRAKQAFVKGIPTAISYDVVRVGNKYGSVFEMLRADNCNDVIAAHPEQAEEIIRKYAQFMRQLHSVEMARGELPEAKTVFTDCLDRLREILPEDLRNQLYALFANLPENLHVIHGDIQMKNVMLSDGEPILIDMETLSAGDPVFDLQGLFLTYQLFNEDEPDNTINFLGLSKKLADMIWEKTISYYFENRTEEAVRDAERKIRIVAYIRFLDLLHTLGIGRRDLTPIRTEHTIAHLRELVNTVDSVAIES